MPFCPKAGKKQCINRMIVKTIFEDTINEYSELIDMDTAENMQRMYYRGIAELDSDGSKALSLLIWELQSVDSPGDTTSELKFIYAADPSYLSSLLEDYQQEAMDEDVKKTVFEMKSLDDDRQAALKDCGFTLTPTESRDIEVTLKDCLGLPIARRKAPSYIQSIVSLDNSEFNHGLMNIMFRYSEPALEDLMYLPREWFDQTVSCCVKTDGRVNGFLLVHTCPSGTIIPVLFYALGSDYKQNLVELLRYAISRAAESYPQDTVVRIHRRSEAVESLTGRLFPGKKGAPVIFGERAE